MRKKKGHLFFLPHTCPKSEEGSVTACGATRSVGFRYARPCLNLWGFMFKKNTGGKKFTHPHTQGKVPAILEEKTFLVLLSMG